PDVGEHEVEGAVDLAQRAAVDLEPIGHLVPCRVLPGGGHGGRVDVDPHRRPRTQAERDDGEDAAAAAHVEDAVPRTQTGLEGGDHEAGGRVAARPEGATRIEHDHD